MYCRQDDACALVEPQSPSQPTAAAFRRCLDLLTRHRAGKGALLEIGCGAGTRLQEALNNGYRAVHGVEAARNLVSQAPVTIRGHITCDVFRPALFRAAHFDTVCILSAFDELDDPLTVLEECWRVLRPGGMLVAVTNPGRLHVAQLVRLFDPDADESEAQPRTPPAVDRLLATTGFKLLEVEPVGEAGDFCLIARKPRQFALSAAA